MKIVVLAGGLSPEREVSLTSGCLIANALMKNGHEVLLLDVYLGMPSLPERPERLFSSVGHYEHSVSAEVPDLEALKASSGNGNALIGKNVMELCKLADKVFLALHGAMGENGQLQATLDSFGIPYTGSGYDGSLLAMDKDLSKRLMQDAEVPTPDWICFHSGEDRKEEILKKIGLPCVIKPTGCGSSVGVSPVDTEKELEEALKNAAFYGERILAEKRIFGRELTMGILGDLPLPPVEIIPREGFYDYKNKYQGTTREICPADIPPEVVTAAEKYILKAFRALHLKGYARFDFIMDSENRLWFLEVNNLPGMTPTSLLPLSASVAGISYEELCERIVGL